MRGGEERDAKANFSHKRDTTSRRERGAGKMSSTNGAEESVVRASPLVLKWQSMRENGGGNEGERGRERGRKRGMCGHCVHGAPAIMCQKNDTKIINKYIHGTTWAIRRGNSLWVIFPHAFRLFFHCATLPPLFLPPALPVPFGNHFSIARAIYHRSRRSRSTPHRTMRTTPDKSTTPQYRDLCDSGIESHIGR